MMDRVQAARVLRTLIEKSREREKNKNPAELLALWKKFCAKEGVPEDPVAVAREVLGTPATYTVSGIDGSQIYPDRHAALPFVLINVGGSLFSYAAESSVSFFSHIDILPVDELNCDEDNYEIGYVAKVNQIRGEKELAEGLAVGTQTRGCTILFDGSLVWFHLVAQKQEQEAYRNRIHAWFKRLHENNVLHGGYVSAPQSRDLIRLIEQYGDDKIQTNGYTDADLAAQLLQPGQRTAFFPSTQSFDNTLPRELRPLFCYLQSGAEIGRLEVPAWIGENAILSEHFCALVYDQCCKGNGYPRCLAEAHEQVVITAADRSFFCQLVEKELAQIGDGKKTSKKAQLKAFNPS